MTGQRLVYLAGMVAAMLGVSSCAGDQPPALGPSQPAADLTFSKGYDSSLWGDAGLQKISVAPDEQCKSLKLRAVITSTFKDQPTLRTPAGAPTYVFALTNHLRPSTTHVLMGSAVGNPPQGGLQGLCQDAVSFTPQADHAYSVKQTVRYGVATCPIEIIDTATGAPVPDLRPAPTLAMCGTRP